MARDDPAVADDDLVGIARRVAEGSKVDDRDVLAGAAQEAFEPLVARDPAAAADRALEDDRAVVALREVLADPAVADGLRRAGEEVGVAGVVHRVHDAPARS